MLSDGKCMSRYISLTELAKALIRAGFKSDTENKEGYISIEEAIKEWDNKPLCVEYKDGADAMLQDNRYTLDDAIGFALDGCTFFYD